MPSAPTQARGGKIVYGFSWEDDGVMRYQRLKKAGTWPVSASVLPEQSGGEGNSSSRLRFFIFAAGLDFFLTDFELPNFAESSPDDLSVAGT